MSRFQINLNARREALGMDVKEVASELNRRGYDLAYQTVAGWFNGNRGGRWKVKELKALLDILQTDLAAMAGDEAELVEEPILAKTTRAMRTLTPEQQQSVLTMIESFRGNR